jgi:SSS family solute:Na+ symporter
MPEPLIAVANDPTKIGRVDLIVVIVYLVAIISIGCWAGLRRKRAKGADYFLAGRSLPWVMIGLALFATNISTIHLVSLAEAGYTSGLLYGNFEWMAGFTLIVLALFFAPFYIRANVATLPDFLEKRYSRGSRDYLAVLSIFSAVVVHVGFSLYTGAVVLEGSVLSAFIDNPEQYRMLTIVGICGAAALYTIIGGLTAVVVTESIETVVLIIGAVCITIFGLNMIGGWNELQAYVHPANFQMCRPDCDPTGISWYAVFLGYPVLGIWYWCTDQTIVQRVLGAKDENHARIGPLFASLIKILPVFIFVLPGLICLGLINKGEISALPVTDAGTPDSGKTYSHMILSVLPTGASGVVVAALLAALMSTLSGAMNSIGTLVSYDIYKRWVPSASDHTLIRVGRMATFGAMVVAILWSLAIGGLGKTIFQAMVDTFPVVAPPTAVVFTWGVFWRRASARAALITLIGGSLLGLLVSTASLMGWNKVGDFEVNSLLSAFLLFVLESILMVVLSYIYPQEHTAESEALVWKSPLEALRDKPGHWLLNYRVWAGVVFLAMVGLYIYWAGYTDYYPIRGKLSLADGSPVVGAEVTFRCDQEKFNFAAVTDPDGVYRYGTPQQAGGAPAGTHYEVKVVSQDDLIVRMKTDPETKKVMVDQILYTVPKGTPIDETSTPDGGKVLSFEVRSGGDSEQTVEKKITVGKDEQVEVIRATPVPGQYGDFDTSGLTCTVEALPMFSTQRETCNFVLQ